MGVNGLHHVTAITGDAAANAAFWTGGLGLRLVKRTVNFDAPSVWHLYYGDRTGSPGTIMTFFPFERAARGRPGTGEAGVTEFAVPAGSLGFWEDRLAGLGVTGGRETAFGGERLRVTGPEGIGLAFAETDDPRIGWDGAIPADRAIKGFRGVVLTLAEAAPTAAVLRLLGYEEAGSEAIEDGRRLRFARPDAAGTVEIEERPGLARAREGAGSVHHVAFAVPDDAAELALRDRVTAAGIAATPQIDRDYFRSVYFRTPGGVLFEIATEIPGFTVDEPEETLGSTLRIPAQHRHLRQRIEAALPPLGL